MQPIIKWAGGKRQLLGELKKRLPAKFNDYHEPFIGAGALYLALEPANTSHINDFNHSLVNLYLCVRDHKTELIKQLDMLEQDFNTALDKEAFYYQKRERYNDILNKDSYEEAALLIFLNRAGYNGLYRVNSTGLFNVPFGKKQTVNLMSDRIESMNQLLKQAVITEGDFEKVVENAQAGDFVYFDPPYDETFAGYQADGFSKDDQKRLAKLFKKLTDKGVFCMLSNSATDFILDLYKDYNITKIPVKRLINRNPKGRTDHEVIVTNYD